MTANRHCLQMDPRAELLLLALLLFCCGCGPAAAKWLFTFGILAAIQYFLLPVTPQFLAVILTILTVFARKIFPCLIENPCKKPSVIDLRFHAVDWACLVLAAEIAVYTIWFG